VGQQNTPQLPGLLAAFADEHDSVRSTRQHSFGNRAKTIRADVMPGVSTHDDNRTRQPPRGIKNRLGRFGALGIKHGSAQVLVCQSQAVDGLAGGEGAFCGVEYVKGGLVELS
jgi:hypothetical protein